MATIEEMVLGLDQALATARAEYRDAVVELAAREAGAPSSERAPADVDRIHHARTRVIALEAAREELGRMGEASLPTPD